MADDEEGGDQCRTVCMIRSPSILLTIWVMLNASSRLPVPDVVESGRVAASLSDVQTMLYFLMVLIVALVIERWASGWQARSTADKFAKAAEKLADAMKADGAQSTVQLALIQRELSDIRQALGGDQRIRG